MTSARPNGRAVFSYDTHDCRTKVMPCVRNRQQVCRKLCTHMKELMTIDVEKLNMPVLFSDPNEKGSGEWKSANPVLDDVVKGFKVSLPKRPTVVRGKDHTLYIIANPITKRFRGAQ